MPTPQRRTCMNSRRLGVVLVATAVALALFTIADASPAGADCSGPTVRHPVAALDRGDPIVVEGTTMGDNCYDFGAPPPGQSALGRPLTGIEIVLLQGTDEWTLWSGDADEDYTMVAEVIIPLDATPGPARIETRLQGGSLAADWQPEVEISTEAPNVGATSAPGTGRPDGGPANPKPKSGTGHLIGVQLSILVAALGIGSAIWIRRRRATEGRRQQRS